MFKKNKKAPVVVEETYEDFKVPVIKEDFTDKLNRTQEFNPDHFSSPIWGQRVKDDTQQTTSSGLIEPKKGYDFIRDEKDKQLSEADLIREYGTKYHEFDFISNKSRKEIFGKDAVIINEEKNKKVKKDLVVPFGLASEVAKPAKPIYEMEDKALRVEKEPEIELPDLVFEDKPSYSFEDLVASDTFEVEEEVVVEPKKKVIEPVFQIVEETEEFSVSEPKAQKRAEPKEKPAAPLITSYEDYEFPPLFLLEKKSIESVESTAWIDEQIEIINNTLTEFEIVGKVVNFTKGPTVTRYEVKLEAGVNVRKVLNIEDNLKMRLAAKTLRIHAPIPGKPNVGLEVPNAKADMVYFGNIVDSEEFRYNNSNLKVAMGLDIDGKNIYLDIGKMPHAMVAGSTGSGKSVCINTILISLLLRNRPSDLKLMLIDPKFVELTPYNDLPHLVTPVITDAKMASVGLKWAVEEMERRYGLFMEMRCKEINSFNEKILGNPQYQKMPYIVIVIDELADLMLVAGQDVEDAIQRITQKARAAGIHLIVATQRPTTDVIKGTIKVNIPTRISFRVISHTDSQTILDAPGAESLLGRGDMLIKDAEFVTRVQGAYLSEKEIDAVTDFIRERNNPDYLFQHDVLVNKVAQISTDDELLYEVARHAIENESVSINGIQKAFGIGFNRGQKIIEMLEAMGIVSKSQGGKGREVLVTMDELDERFR
ncbi:MAG: DNA translocase FtsK [Erysipelotrichales bacterium]|nr:DNA translocase FtsK [Erysipelotrichales bacterium]